MKTRFQALLEERDFLFTFELVPARSVRTRKYQEIIKFLFESQKKNLFQAFSITDNAGGNPAISPIPLGKTIKNLGLEPIIHFSCKDKNRNQIESELLALDREGLHNLLVLTGDYPHYGYLGRAKPVYDLDSVLLLLMISDMERGFDERPSVPFFKGAVVNPFKLTLPETWWQYLKFYKKLRGGAYFIITQVGFYPKKWLELKTLLDSGITFVFSKFFEDKELHSEDEDESFKKIPLFGSILYLTPFLVRTIKEAKIPGILLTESVLNRLERASNFEDEALEIAAKFASILKGLGYKGIHLCGFPLDYVRIEKFFEKFSKYESHWEKFFEEFEGKAFFVRDGRIIKREIPCLIKEDFDFSFKGKFKFSYYINELFHNLLFNPERVYFSYLERIAKYVDGSPLLKKYFTYFEYFIKKLLFNCQECGDCTLWEFNYNCPQSGCAKCLLNGPCGGSLNGFCEVSPQDKRCHFVKAFEEAHSKKVIKKFMKPGKTFFLPPRNWDLFKTSSWINFYLRRDHKAL